ncbi:hypothetical protein B0H14DRAFT_2600141 [Mycena olivaceomarginata]|nr:hypothetical protein B0H14DRAFT_2600141 [Mycena olivaceomarginata]
MQECKREQRHKSDVSGQIIAMEWLRKRDMKIGGLRSQFHRELGATTELFEIESKLYSPQGCRERWIKILNGPGLGEEERTVGRGFKSNRGNGPITRDLRRNSNNTSDGRRNGTEETRARIEIATADSLSSSTRWWKKLRNAGLTLGRSRVTHGRKNTIPKKKGPAFIWKEFCRMSYVASRQDDGKELNQEDEQRKAKEDSQFENGRRLYGESFIECHQGDNLSRNYSSLRYNRTVTVGAHNVVRRYTGLSNKHKRRYKTWREQSSDRELNIQ